ncbi:hypothetical protein [Tardiphaga sp. P5_C7]
MSVIVRFLFMMMGIIKNGKRGGQRHWRLVYPRHCEGRRDEAIQK